MKSNVLINICSYVFLQVITVVSGFIIPRIFLLEYGSEINGLVSSCTQFISYLTLVEMGISQAAVLALYGPMTARSVSKINSVIASISKLYRKISRYFIVGLMILLVLYPYLIHTNMNSVYIRMMILILAMQNLLDYLWMGKYKAILISDQKQYVMVNIQTLMTVVSTFFSYFFIINHFDALIVKAIIPVTYLIRCMYISYYTKSKYYFINEDANEDGDYIKNRLYILIHQISGLIVNSTDITILTIVGKDLMAVSVYSIYNMVISQLLSLINSIFNGALPFFGQLLTQKGKEKILQEYFRRYCFVFYLLVFIAFTVAFCVYPAFIKLFTSGVDDVKYYYYYYVVAFIIVGLIEALKSPYILIVASGGYYEETTRDALIETAINLVTSIILCAEYGIIGVLFGTFLAHFIRFIFLLRIKNLVGFEIDNLHNIYLIVVNIMISLSCVYVFQRYWAINIEESWLAWMTNCIALTILVSLYYFIICYFMVKKDFLWLFYYVSTKIKCRRM